MNTLRTIFAELIGLFVDDERFAIAILAWLALCWLILPHLPGPAAPLILTGGLIAILLESAVRRARK
jgi:hypothetical protein